MSAEYPLAQYPDIVLFRPRSSGRGYVLTFVRGQVEDLLRLGLNGHLFAVSEAGVRVR